MLGKSVDAVAGFLTAYRGSVYFVLTVLIFIVTYKILTKNLRKYLFKQAYKDENVRQFLFFWRYAWLGVGFVFAIMSLSGSLASLGISAAFLGMILGWSLQAPVTGIAAWLMMVLVKPFRIGDRVIIGGIVGDVTDITLTHVILNQVGGTISGEEKSGRGVLIPNATMFGQIIYNYTFETKYIMDEVPVMITFDSDLDLAEKLCMDAANKIVGAIVKETGTVPFIRREFTDWGVRIRVRYQCEGVDRQRISSDIIKLILEGFNATEGVTFCYPHTEIVYHPETGQKRELQNYAVKEEARQ